MKKSRYVFMTAILIAMALCTSIASSQTARWSEQQANEWYAQQPWLVGSNYIPKSAINELEMWQEATFDPAQIDRELGWAEAMGMNTMRVFLHDLLWQQDAVGFRKRIDQFLTIAARHHIRPLFVLFDSCWDPLPQLGRQHPPVPGVHNSGWVQSPGAKALADPSQYPRLKEYVQGVVGAFAKDDRILGWDIWNEPGSDKTDNYPKSELKNKDKITRVAALLPQAFAWAREMNPTQPLTSGVYEVDTSRDESSVDELRFFVGRIAHPRHRRGCRRGQSHQSPDSESGYRGCHGTGQLRRPGCPGIAERVALPARQQYRSLPRRSGNPRNSRKHNPAVHNSPNGAEEVVVRQDAGAQI